jgi:hypothetical protein
MTLPSNVTSVLAALAPQDALHDAFTRARGRGGASNLFEGYRLVDEAEAAQLLGAEVPTLPALRRPGVVERIGVRSFMPGPEQVVTGSVLGSLRVTYLPAGLQWQNAQVWPLLREGGVVLEVMVHDVDPRRQRAWPRRLSRHGEVAGGDYVVAVVEGCEVGVQVNVSGVAYLTWVAHRDGKVLRLALMVESAPQAALELVVSGGLLS